MEMTFAQKTSRWLWRVCNALILVYAVILCLGLAGRQAFLLHTPAGDYIETISADAGSDAKDHRWFLGNTEAILVEPDEMGRIPTPISVALSLMSLPKALLGIAAFWLLGRVFKSAGQGRPITKRNAVYTFSFGLLRLLSALASPWLKKLICRMANSFTDASVTVTPRTRILLPAVIFVLSAALSYVIYTKSQTDN